jgi:murein L,D-transpeptidase YafK
MLRNFFILICIFWSLNAVAYDDIWLLVDTNALKIEVKRGEQTIDIIEGIAIGQAGAGHKSHRGDNITPYGEYRIGWVGERSSFHRFFGLNYPSVQDADDALRQGVIDRFTYSDIINAHMVNQVPPQNTPLGGRVGIHGLGSASLKIHQSMNWTHGCIAMTDQQIDHLSQWINTGTLVKIK